MSDFTIERLKGRSKATAGQFNLTLEICRDIEVPLFKIEDQYNIVKEIESRLSVANKIEENVEQALKQTEALRQSILKKAFEGRLLSDAELAEARQEPDWEPASVLLERIKAQKAATAATKRSKRGSKKS